MSRTRVAIVRGGISDEFAVSMRTGDAVLRNIDRKLFEPVDIIIAKNGEWILDGRVRMPEYVLHSVDIVFNALHGKFGEDGTIQRLFDRYAVPYTGSKAMPSGIAMNKVVTKNILKESGIKMAPHLRVSRESSQELGRIVEKITDTFGPQYIIKPVSSGSSVGTMSVKNPLLLHQALTDALSRYDEVMVEAKIPGREATCGVVERYRGKDTYALPTIEIVVPHTTDFFDAEVKYNGATKEICPSCFDPYTKDEIERISCEVHTIIGLSQYSRSDFIVADDGIYFLEVNTLPGLTDESLFPKALNAVGATYTDFVTHLLHDSLNSQQRGEVAHVCYL